MLDDAVGRKNAHLADFRDDTIITAFFIEPAVEAFCGQPGNGPFVTAEPSHGDGAIVDIGRKNLHLGFAATGIHGLADQNRDCISFLAGSAAWHPDTNFVVGAFAGEQRADNQRRQRLESGGVTKKLRHADQQFVEQHVEFFGFFAIAFDIGS